MGGKPVCKGGIAKGGQGGLPKRPIRQVKTNSGGQKKGAKSILGQNCFRKVVLECFLFSACTLLQMLLNKSITLEDIEEVDPTLHKGLRWMLDNNIDGDGENEDTKLIDTTFSVEFVCPDDTEGLVLD